MYSLENSECFIVDLLNFYCCDNIMSSWYTTHIFSYEISTLVCLKPLHNSTFGLVLRFQLIHTLVTYVNIPVVQSVQVYISN